MTPLTYYTGNKEFDDELNEILARFSKSNDTNELCQFLDFTEVECQLWLKVQRGEASRNELNYAPYIMTLEQAEALERLPAIPVTDYKRVPLVGEKLSENG